MDLLYVFNRYFFENEYMHFGYWEHGLELKYANLKTAQQRYVEEFQKLIPADVHSMLDVGCGSGEMASQFLDKGYKVDCVCPPTILSHYASEKLAGRASVHEAKFEDLKLDGQSYDLIYFSESFQFINMRRAFEQCRRYGNQYMLVADVFRKDMPERGPIGGGHKYQDFLALVEEFGFEELANVDVTEFTGPGFDLESDAMENFIRPLVMVMGRIVNVNNSLLARFALFLNRKRLQRLRTKYLDNPGARNRDSFAEYKTYRFVLLKIR